MAKLKRKYSGIKHVKSKLLKYLRENEGSIENQIKDCLAKVLAEQMLSEITTFSYSQSIVDKINDYKEVTSKKNNCKLNINHNLIISSTLTKTKEVALKIPKFSK